jgi:HK97 family phage major capsid protein
VERLRAVFPLTRDLDRLEKTLTRAVVPAHTTDNTAALVEPDAFGEAFLAELEPQSALGKLGYTPVPPNVKVPASTGEVTAMWVPEGRAIPVYQGQFGTVTLDHFPKIGGIVVVTRELARSSDPRADLVFGQLLTNAVIRGSDRALLDPALAATADTPASITNGAPSIPSTGSDAAAMTADIAQLSGMLTAAGFPFTGRSYITSGAIAEHLAGLRLSGGMLAFPDVAVGGGTLGGVPLVVSDQAGPQIVLVHGPSILAAVGAIDLSTSENALLEMVDTPVGDVDPPASGPELVSMYQTDSVAMRCIRYLNFAPGRPGAVARIADVVLP